jgi:hypothetical protein
MGFSHLWVIPTYGNTPRIRKFPQPFPPSSNLGNQEGGMRAKILILFVIFTLQEMEAASCPNQRNWDSFVLLLPYWIVLGQNLSRYEE